MRPPLLTEDAIRAAIRELSANGDRVTGVAVRSLLASRYGARGGVTRIYRVLREATQPAPAVVGPARAFGDESRESAIARADLAEHRERIHQERWARETDALRTRLAVAEQAARGAEQAALRVRDLTRALASAQARITALERALEERSP